MIEKLTHLKRKYKLTTEDIAAQSAVPLGTLNKIFAGQTKNPALTTMDNLCRVFNVPIRYVLDDTVPDDYSVAAYAESHGMFMISDSEAETFQAYRTLSDLEQRCIMNMIHQFQLRRPDTDHVSGERLLPCYEPIACGRHGMFLDSWTIRTLCVPVNHLTKDADFALVINTDGLTPSYQMGNIISVRQRECGHEELGVFFYNGEGYIRRLKHKRGQVCLVSIINGVKSIHVSPKDELRCLGVVLGTIRSFCYV